MSSFQTRLQLPIADYRTDTKTVLDQYVRVLQAMVDVAADAGLLTTCLNTMHMAQMAVQARWYSDSSLLQLPAVTEKHVAAFARLQPAVLCLPQLVELVHADDKAAQRLLRSVLVDAAPVRECVAALRNYPVLDVACRVDGAKDGKPLALDAEYTLHVSDQEPFVLSLLAALVFAHTFQPATPSPQKRWRSSA